MRFLPLLAACGVGAAVIREYQQVPILEHVESNTQRLEEKASDRPSIAVHFTSSHAIPAARYPNGTIVDLRTVEGDAEYISLMARWTTVNLKPVHEEITKRQDWCQAHPHYEECRSNIVRRPRPDECEDLASRDTAILSKLLMQVRISVEAELDLSMTTFVPVFFELHSNQTEIVQAAIDLVGLRSTHFTHSTKGDILLDTAAAYAGTGALLCKSWMDSKSCKTENLATHEKAVLFLSFDNHVFSASVRRIRSEAKSHSVGTRIFSPELGWWSLPVFEVPRAKFWARIHEAIVDVVGALGGEPIDKIVLTGEHGADEEFKGVVETAIWSVSEVDVRSMLRTNKIGDAGRIVARGAAEMAWRREYWRGMADARGASFKADEGEDNI